MSDEKTRADLLRFARWCRDHDETPGVLVYAHNADDIEAFVAGYDALLVVLRRIAFEPQGASDASPAQVLAAVEQIAKDAIAKAEGQS